ncbi:Fpg/Nei family DNA glycosylase [Saccharopolyspora rosea]|uniref:Fpg/Nei family DNA glycosylase n=1 Tax=Saccharopolyspora rosea TaxID=524884 RepID=A0ABW3FRM5_9PSEU|nr:DNA-formamidopyrimidine glycosylase family protein [Saccharopolyspora rosea]
MPELPDVEGFRRVAEEAVKRQVRAVHVHDAQVLRDSSAEEFADALRRRYVAEPSRHGKWLMVPTASSAGGSPAAPWVLLHFGMTGSLRWCEHDAELHPHDRVVFDFADGELRYRDMRKLTGLHLAREQDEVDRQLDELGPDALEVGRDEFTERLTRTRRRIKPALMDQSIIAGLGNLCADEILWRSRINPARAATDLTSGEFGRVHGDMRSMLRQAIRVGRVPDRASWLTGHRDEPDPHCPRCSTALSRGRVGGRSTLWCPHCQPE